MTGPVLRTLLITYPSSPPSFFLFISTFRSCFLYFVADSVRPSTPFKFLCCNSFFWCVLVIFFLPFPFSSW
ncbi:hypothetical protein PIB30_040526 [Stylosanthes scabra]|uniref:Uncharacterized protein n=1 Tax=Stylosanthes scabra TaxID=79078 RepID=A0ABU6SFZ1_9FABA|nr:hypothetical protein [Stylosanthes scabra]